MTTLADVAPTPVVGATCTLDDCVARAVFAVIGQGQLPDVFACRVHHQMTLNGLGLIRRLFGIDLVAYELKEPAVADTRGVHHCVHCGIVVEWEEAAGWVDPVSGDDGGVYDHCSLSPTKEHKIPLPGSTTRLGS